jgi:hypothetical protein
MTEKYSVGLVSVGHKEAGRSDVLPEIQVKTWKKERWNNANTKILGKLYFCGLHNKERKGHH